MHPISRRAVLGSIALAAGTSGALGVPPEYQIFDLGIIADGDAAQGLRVSPGGVCVGRTLGSNQAFSWTQSGGQVALPNVAGHPFGAANSANDNGVVVGTGATTFFGSSPLPLMWTNGVVSQLPLPAGETLGRANSVNASGDAVGSVDGGSNEQAAIYTGPNAGVITTTTSGGATMTTAYGVNDAGLVVGTGIDPSNAARNVGFIYDSATGTASEVGALTGANGALCFDVSNAGHVVGSSMMNQGSGKPFIWTEAEGIKPVPLPAGTSQGIARGVNSSGWVVGIASNAFAIPFLYDGVSTYGLQELLPVGSGWDVSMNTSSGALGISDNGIIVGTGLYHAEIRAFAMVPVAPPACPCDWNDDGNLNDQDFFDWANDFFSQSGPKGQYDFNDDGFQNDQDWFDFANCFFSPPIDC